MPQTIVNHHPVIPTKVVFILIIAFITFTASNSLAQPDSLWSNIYGGPGHDHCWGMISANDGGFALVGSYDGRYLDISATTFCLVKTDSLGQQEWLRYWDQFSRGGRSVVQNSDNGFIMVGTSGWILKTDSTGELEWSRHYENIVTFDRIKSLTDSTYIISGHGESPDDDQDVLLFKIDNEGNTLWRQHYGTETSEWCHDVDLTFDGGFILAGGSSWQGERGLDGIAVKVDSEGELEWENSFGVEGDYFFEEVSQMPDSGYVFVGSYLDPEDDYHYYAVRTDRNGEEIWARVPNNNYGFCHSVTVTPDKGIILAGGAYENEDDRGMDFCLIRLDFNGEILYQKNYDSDYDTGQRCNSIIRMPDGGYALGGRGGRVPDNWELMNTNFWLMRTGPDIIRWLDVPDTNFVLGDTLTIELDWFSQFISPTSYIDSALTFEVTRGELYVDARTVDDRLIIYCDSAQYESGVTDSIGLIVYETDNEDNVHETWIDVTINEPNSVDVPIMPPTAYILYPAFSNPFNSITALSFQLPERTDVSLHIHDVNGRLVASLIDGVMEAGYHHTCWTADNVPTGIYFCRMNAGGHVKSVKLILLK